MERVFVDTSGWVALFIKNDSNHVNAVSSYERLRESGSLLYTSDYVIDETITTILSRAGKKKSIQVGEILFSTRLLTVLPITPQYFTDSWKIYKAYLDKNFSFTDATSLALMKKLGISRMIGFDQEFRRVGIELL